MDDEVYYVYGLTWPDCPTQAIGPAVDPRFDLELVPSGSLAALASRVGLDQFDLAKLQSGTADIEWLSQVAVWHNAIVGEAARRRPVLPMRMGVLFRSRASLLERMAKHESAASDFLNRLGDRQEWAAKIYLDASRAEQACAKPAAPSSAAPPATGAGAQYLMRQRQREQSHLAVKQNCRQEIRAAEAALAGKADSFCEARILPASLTGRREKMMWNGAFLIAPPACPCWLELADDLARTLADKGLLLEVTGPWPAYHFCPEMT